MENKAKIKEIFTSIQGEGPFIGYKQLFVRFCGCNLNCNYCDTDFSETDSMLYSVNDLVNIVNVNNDCHSVSLTGGEPLLHVDFLLDFLPKCTLPIYLETNATLSDNLSKIINYVDYISSDIKLSSCSYNADLLKIHDEFFSVAFKKILFAKIVFDKNITDEEINLTALLGKKYGIELVLQPKNEKNSMFNDSDFVENVHNKYLKTYKNVRVIPQMHKYLSLR